MTSEVVHEAVSIPDVVAIIQAINITDQCRKADARIAEYNAANPLINFERTEDQINYQMDLLSIQEEVRLKFSTIKQEEFRLKNERYKELLISWEIYLRESTGIYRKTTTKHSQKKRKIHQNHPLQKNKKPPLKTQLIAAIVIII
ncbi:hypothetical protein NPIL_497131 [Nephila pilipes]|uniref:Uncharacterized protein n=1 Tax=Nephila pilipes TaxID=299642 RepID=A0A8X6N6K1_NEPPI|nr:hypothetical protein NPIL_497131 [Nephila pilipes]